MSVTFFANQTVTADDLNSIATDLGGESPGYAEDNTYEVDSLNAITAAAVSPGVSINGFAPFISDGIISTTSGIAFFSDGYKFRLDKTVSITTELTDGYVYLLKNEDQTVELLATETEPPETAILIAILTGGTIDDRRVYATAKAEGTGSQSYQKVLPAYFAFDENISGWQSQAEIYPAFSNPRYVILDTGIALTLPEEGEYIYYPSYESAPKSSDHGRYYIENGVIKIDCRNLSGSNKSDPYRGYIELR